MLDEWHKNEEWVVFTPLQAFIDLYQTLFANLSVFRAYFMHIFMRDSNQLYFHHFDTD